MTNNTIIQTLTAIDTPTLANAIEKLEVRNATEGFCDRNLKCIFPDLGTMCGVAVTCEVETMNPDEPGRLDQPFWDLCKAIEVTEGPAVVVLQETGPRGEFAAHCGEVLSTTFMKLGAVGLVSDCGVRDLPEVHAMGFQYFAQGVVASHGNFRFTRAGGPVTVCGMDIAPGDLLHGDANGLLKVPEEGRDRMKDLAAGVTAAEKKIMDFVKGDDFTIDGMRDLITH